MQGKCRSAEAGLAVRRIEPIARFYATPAKSPELTRLFCGEVDATGAAGVHGLAREGEDIRVIPMPPGEAFALLGVSFACQPPSVARRGSMQ